MQSYSAVKNHGLDISSTSYLRKKERIDRYSTRFQIATCVIIIALTFNIALCFVNTNIFSISKNYVILSEIGLISIAALLALDRKIDLYVIIISVLSYLIFIMSLRGELDLKAARDILIPIIFYFLGRRIASPQFGDRIVLISIYIVLGFSLFEWFFLKDFLSYFNVVQYYIAKGALTVSETEYLSTDLFVSGMRPEGEGRTLLPFLGNHRVSSIFLEPVSMGNFCAIIFSWLLFREPHLNLKLIAKLIPLSIILILADSRFGLTLCIVVVILNMTWRFIPRWMVFLAPFALMLMLAFYALDKSIMDVDNGFHGRIIFSGLVLESLTWAQIFGISLNPSHTVDSGYAYSLTETGLIGLIVLWGIFIFASSSSNEGWRMILFVSGYLLLLLIISNSSYSIKTAALLWTLVGISGSSASILIGSQNKNKIR